MGNKIKVCIALACTDVVKAKTAFSLVHAVRGLDFEIDMIMNVSCDIIGSRVWLAREAKKRGNTHLMMIDSDMFFPSNGGKTSPIARLVAHDKDIIGAAYNFRKLPATSTSFPLEPDKVDNTKIFKCHVVGTGFLMVKTAVFDKIPEPWFLFGRDKEGLLINGEDAWFCQQAIKVGYDVWADPTLGVKHLGEYQY
jgi:hypothetical protein